MKNRVLFCPVGMTDPYRDCFEGPSLQINRYYKPQKIYIFYTKEIAELAKSDDRFKDALYAQSQNLRSKNDQPEILEFFYPELGDPSDFDALNIPYVECLDKIIADNPDVEILINISSGTPQMVATACLIGVTRYREKDYRLIQVKNPEKKSGRQQAHLYTYSEDEISSLFDNELNAENRCSEPPVAFFEETMRREQFEKLIRRYDYAGAVGVVAQYPRAFTETVSRTVTHMKGRAAFNYLDADRIIKNEDKEAFSFFPVQTTDYRKIYEFYLATHIRYLQNDWHDYLLRLSPLLTNLMELYMQKRYNFSVHSIARQDGDAWKLNTSIMMQKMPELPAFLNGKSETGRFWDTYISLNNLLWILEFLMMKSQAQNEEQKIYSLFQDLRAIESRLRNLVAHQMVVVSDDWAKSNSGKSFIDIQSKLVELVGLVCGKNFGDGWETLPQRFNNYLLRLIG